MEGDSDARITKLSRQASAGPAFVPRGKAAPSRENQRSLKKALFRRKSLQTEPVVEEGGLLPFKAPKAPNDSKGIRQNSFVCSISRHIEHFQSVLGVKKQENSPDKIHVSCPRLPITPDSGEQGKPRSGEGRESRASAHLTVPDIFVTSLTRSHSDNNCQAASDGFGQSLENGFSKSNPEILAASRVGRLPRKRDSVPSLAVWRQTNLYRDDSIFQIMSYLYLGDVDAGYNEHLLCKLGIDSLIDITNLSPSNVPQRAKRDCPCVCKSQSKHFRPKLYVPVDDEENEPIQQYFSDINAFIEGARKRQKAVLVFSYCGISRAPTAVIQYLMRRCGILLRQAYNLVKNKKSNISINSGFQRYLCELERSLYPNAVHSVMMGNEFINVCDPGLIRTAWRDS